MQPAHNGSFGSYRLFVACAQCTLTLSWHLLAIAYMLARAARSRPMPEPLHAAGREGGSRQLRHPEGLAGGAVLRRRGAAGFGSAAAACGRAARSAGELHVAKRRRFT